uniref:cDNA n=1 Tax=Heterorhabditis bacteriophora TaxID=37862 RepID=A0A1I7X9G3_HETBA
MIHTEEARAPLHSFHIIITKANISDSTGMDGSIILLKNILVRAVHFRRHKRQVNTCENLCLSRTGCTCLPATRDLLFSLSTISNLGHHMPSRDKGDVASLSAVSACGYLRHVRLTWKVSPIMAGPLSLCELGPVSLWELGPVSFWELGPVSLYVLGLPALLGEVQISSLSLFFFFLLIEGEILGHHMPSRDKGDVASLSAVSACGYLRHVRLTWKVSPIMAGF